ncbi:pentapeptide repeat-containing protein [Actinoplanes sp. NPDC024001]|uniref:WD40 domain-containing protein n=1 Tax=Actinoplanes sp. NPDC024001 TaxID=3154598 RepID=UPI0033CC7583
MTSDGPSDLPLRSTVSFPGPGSGSRPLGFGLLIGPRQVVTTIAVINRVLGRSGATERPDQSLPVAFPRLRSGGTESSLTARVVLWKPGDQIAGLEIDGVLPIGATPGLLADGPLPSRAARVFGFPSEPGAVSGTVVDLHIGEVVAHRRIEVTRSRAGAPGLGPGFGGSPAYDPVSGTSAGLLLALEGDADENIAYLVSAAEIRRVWPGGFAVAPGPGRLSLLHLSELRFGDPDGSTAHSYRLAEEIGRQRDRTGIRPDLIVVSGDLTATGEEWPFTDAAAWLRTLAQNLGLPVDRIIVVPGELDVSRRLRTLNDLEALLLKQPARTSRWRPFADAMDELYRSPVERPGFDDQQPWSVFAYPDLRVAVAGFNSAMTESGHEGEHGQLTDLQISDLAERMRLYREDGWLRLGVVHHPPAGAGLAEHRLVDAGALAAAAGDQLISLILHGHATREPDGRLEHGPLLLGAGGPGGSFQLIRIGQDELTWHTWSRSATGEPGWQAGPVHTVRHDFGAQATPDPGRRAEAAAFRERVRRATRMRNPGAQFEENSDERDIVVRAGEPAARWPVVRALAGPVTRAQIAAFADRVRGTRAVIVHAGPAASGELRAQARDRDIDLLTLADYQTVIDLSAVVRHQAGRLAATRYVPQAFAMRQPAPPPAQTDDLATEVTGLLAEDRTSVIVVSGGPGSGKTTLLHELARRLPAPDVPLLLDLSGAESFDWLLLRHLFDSGLTELGLDRIRYMIAEGRVVLLLDGADSAPETVLAGLWELLTPYAKVVLTSRDPDRIAPSRARVAVLEDFTADRVEQYLTARFGEAGRTRAALLEENEQLRPFTRNPRMLTLLADLDETVLRSPSLTSGSVTRATVYAQLADAWAAPADRVRALQIAQDPQLRPDAGGYPDESMLDWLVADQIAAALRDGRGDPLLRSVRLTPLACEFLVEIAAERAQEWAATVTRPDEDETAARNAADLRDRVSRALRDQSVPPPATAGVEDLHGRDLRRADLRNRRLAGANLSSADLRGLTLRDLDLSGADLTGADLRDVQMHGGSLAGARLAGSRWAGAVLARVHGVPLVRELDAAVVAGRDPGTVQAVVGGMVHCLDISSDDRLLAAGRGDVVEIVDLTGPIPQTICYLTGHRSTVRGVAFLDTGRVISASEDGTLRIWPIGTGQEPRIVRAHIQPVTALAVSADGGVLISGSVDRTARAWQPDGQPHPRHRALRHGRGEITAVALAPGQPVVVTAATDRTAIAWDLDTARELFRLEHHDTVTGVAFSPDATLIATVADDGEAVLWNAADGSEIGRLPVSGALTCVTFSSDGQLVAVGARDGSVWVCRASHRQLRFKLPAHADEVTAVAFPAGEPYLATAGRDGTIRAWHRDTGRRLRRLDSHTFWASDLAFHTDADGLRLAASTWDGAVMMWRLPGGTAEAAPGGDVGALNGVAWSPDGAQIAAGQLLDPPVAYLWDLRAGERHELAGHKDGVTGVAYSPDGRWLATISEDRSFAVWDAQTRVLLYRKVLGREPVAAVAFRPLSPERPETALAIGHGQVVRLYDPATGEPASEVTLNHERTVNALAFLNNGTRLVTGTGGRFARLWNLSTPGEHEDLTDHGGRGSVNCVAVHPDDSMVATGSADNVVRVFETRGNRCVRELEGHLGGITAVTFSPDGDLLATAARDNTVRIWSCGTWELAATLHVLRAGASVAIRGDGSAYRISGKPGNGIWWSARLRRFALSDAVRPGPLAVDEPLIPAGTQGA